MPGGVKRLAIGGIHMGVMGYRIRQRGEGQAILHAVLRTVHFILKAVGSQRKMTSRGPIGCVS